MSTLDWVVLIGALVLGAATVYAFYLLLTAPLPEKRAATEQTRHDRPKGPAWSRIRWSIGHRDNWTCITGCGATGLSFQQGNGPTSAHVDHIVPLALGGHPTDESNLQLLCGPCNLAKGAARVAPWSIAA
jgi:5-methylcytosine-specific restriction endonuclease McrA